MSNHPTIAALRAALESEIDRVAKDTFGREYSKWNKEEKRPFNYDESFRHGHEAATERLMTIVQKAVEMAQFYSESVYEYKNGDLDMIKWSYQGETDVGQKAREFLSSLSETTDASGEIEKENKFKKIWVHEGYKTVGTSNWTVREQEEKPPKPTAYENDWNDYVPASALESANAEIVLLKRKYEDCYNDYNQDTKNFILENKKLSEQLVICDQAIESLSNDRTEAYEIIDKLEAALNKIGMLGMSEHAYTSEFTERVRNIVTETLK